MNYNKGRKIYPITDLERLLGLQEVGATRISRKSAHRGGKFVSPRPAAFKLRKISVRG
jgi:hypothetical protein